MFGPWTTAWKAMRLPRAFARRRLRQLRVAEARFPPRPPATPAWALQHPDQLAHALAALASAAEPRLRRRHLARRATLLLEEGQHVFAVESGGAKLCVSGADGRRLTLALLGAGDLFGRVTPEAGPGRLVALEALETTAVLVLPRPLVEQTLRGRPDLALSVLQHLEDGQRRLARRLEALLFKDLRTRVVETLLELATEIGRPCAHGFAVDVRLSQEDLAELVGATRQHVNRVLRDLARDLYVQRIGRVLCILDRERLATLVDP